MKRVHVRVHGRVQGVFFRGTTREKARQLGLSGWVRNNDDGTVEAEAEGPDVCVDDLVRWCHEGPPMAAVVRVDVEDRPVTGQEDGFDVRHAW